MYVFSKSHGRGDDVGVHADAQYVGLLLLYLHKIRWNCEYVMVNYVLYAHHGVAWRGHGLSVRVLLRSYTDGTVRKTEVLSAEYLLVSRGFS